MPRTRLWIAEGFSLPLEAVTRATALLAKRGAGKSNAAVVMAEEMHDCGAHWAAIDPKGDWYGVRADAKGKADGGILVPIFGGEYPDYALDADPARARELAAVIVEERISCVIDTSQFSEGDKVRFLGGAGSQDGFAQALFRKKNRHQEPTHLFLEEAHDYIPQQAKGKERLIDAFGKIVAMGRQKGLGCTLITQRSARIHKDVLTQVDNLIVLRTIGPQDRDAVAGWLKYHGESEEILASLATLEDGEAWIWSPEWLGITKRFRFRRRRTFDSGSTPEVGVRGTAVTLADLDMPALERRLTAAREKAKAEDPKELHKRIRDLERTINEQARSLVQDVKEVVREVEVPVIPKGLADSLVEALKAIERIGNDLSMVGDGLSGLHRTVKRVEAEAGSAATARPAGARQERVRRRAPPPAARSQVPGDASLGKAERAFLAVLAQHGPQDRMALAILAGYSSKSGHVDNTLGSLRTKGYVASGWPARATDTGLDALGSYDPLPTGAELRHYWLGHSQITKAGATFLYVLIEAYPEALHRDELATRAGYSVDSGHVDNTLGRLRTMGLAHGPRDAIAASDTLFHSREGAEG